MISARVVRLSSILCLLLPGWAPAQPERQAGAAAQTEVGKVPRQESRVNGILLGAGGLPEEGTEVLLVEAQVWDLGGKPVPTLPAKGTSIVGMVGDASGATVIKGRSRTEAGGRFEFRAAPGRYGIAVAMRGAKGAALLQSERQQRPVVFDLSAAKDVDLGSVSRKKE
jgi:hypothetical protein